MCPSLVCPWQMNPHMQAAHASWLSPHLPPRNLFGEGYILSYLSSYTTNWRLRLNYYICHRSVGFTKHSSQTFTYCFSIKPSSHMWVRKFMFCFAVFLVFLLSVCFSNIFIKLATQDQSPITPYFSKIFLQSPIKKHCLYFTLLSTWGVLTLHVTVVPLWVYYVCPRFLFSSLCTLTFHCLPFTLILSFHFFHSDARITLFHSGLLSSHPPPCTWLSPCAVPLSFFPPFSFSWTSSDFAL